MGSSFAGTGMGAVAGNQLWMGPLKFKQEEALIPGLIGMIAGIPANIMGAILIPRTGAIGEPSSAICVAALVPFATT